MDFSLSNYIFMHNSIDGRVEIMCRLVESYRIKPYYINWFRCQLSMLLLQYEHLYGNLQSCYEVIGLNVLRIAIKGLRYDMEMGRCSWVFLCMH